MPSWGAAAQDRELRAHGRQTVQKLLDAGMAQFDDRGFRDCRELLMSRTVADGLWEMLAATGAQRCYGVLRDALKPTIDALRRNGSMVSVVVHHNLGVFAATAESCLTGRPVAVCGAAAPAGYSSNHRAGLL